MALQCFTTGTRKIFAYDDERLSKEFFQRSFGLETDMRLRFAHQPLICPDPDFSAITDLEKSFAIDLSSEDRISKILTEADNGFGPQT